MRHNIFDIADSMVTLVGCQDLFSWTVEPLTASYDQHVSCPSGIARTRGERFVDDVVIIGAGLTGLTCARRLQEAGTSCVVLEADDAEGGRVRSDVVDGYRLDRDFQVLLTAYPAARRSLDCRALSLQPFRRGALVRCEGGLHRIGDPWREAVTIPATLQAPVRSLADKLRVATLRELPGAPHWATCSHGPRRPQSGRCVRTASAQR